MSDISSIKMAVTGVVNKVDTLSEDMVVLKASRGEPNTHLSGMPLSATVTLKKVIGQDDKSLSIPFYG